jgi:hypothetical protein
MILYLRLYSSKTTGKRTLEKSTPVVFELNNKVTDGERFQRSAPIKTTSHALAQQLISTRVALGTELTL